MNTRSVGLLALAVALGACKSSMAGRPPAGAIIGAADYAFSPDTVTVKAGTVVEWDNNGPSTHSITSDSAVWTSATLSPPGGSSGPYGGSSAGGYFQFTFHTTGTFPYHCSFHPAQMHGVVIVTP